jgi:hypothetical protein
MFPIPATGSMVCLSELEKARAKAGTKADLGQKPRFRNRDLHGELPRASVAVADAISKSRFLSPTILRSS